MSTGNTYDTDQSAAAAQATAQQRYIASALEEARQLFSKIQRRSDYAAGYTIAEAIQEAINEIGEPLDLTYDAKKAAAAKPASMSSAGFSTRFDEL